MSWVQAVAGNRSRGPSGWVESRIATPAMVRATSTQVALSQRWLRRHASDSFEINRYPFRSGAAVRPDPCPAGRVAMVQPSSRFWSAADRMAAARAAIRRNDVSTSMACDQICSNIHLWRWTTSGESEISSDRKLSR